MIAALIVLVFTAAALYFQDRSHRITLNNVTGAYENSLAWERTRVDNLLVQVQANSQGIPHMPMLGPMHDEPDQMKRITDETGLIEVEFDPEYDEMLDRVG